MPIERLSPEDRFMLWPDRRWPQVNGAFLLLHSDGAFGIESLRAAIASHIHAVQRFRQLLQIPPRRLGGPLWIDADRFDIAQHVRERAVEAPAGEPEVLATVEELWCLPLERSRPLWEMWLLTGLSDGRFGVFIRVHHAIADGVATIATLARFLDLSPEVADEEAQPWTPAPPPSERQLLLDSIRERAQRLRRAASFVVHPVKTARSVRAAWPALQEILADKPLPPTSLDAVVGSGHNLAPVKTSLALIKDIAHSNGATVNDVLLGLITGGLRQLFKARGELRPDLIVRISVPVSLRLSERAQAQGNLISAMVVPLPVGTADPVERLRLITAETARRKTLSRPSMGVFPTNRLLGPLILKAIRRQRVNVASTNVPGPSQHLYLAGAQILEVTPLLPLIGNEPLAVGAMSYAGQFNIMAVGDRQLLPDLGEFAAGMRAELATLKPHLVAA